MPSKRPTCLVLTDGRRGIENQALGLTDALTRLRPIDVLNHRLTPGPLFKTASALMQYSLRSKPSDYGLSTKAPEMAVGCGRQAVAPLLALKQEYPACFTTYIQDPRIATNRFDLVIAPEHDDLSGDNIIPMIGSPNRINENGLVGQTLEFSKQLGSLPMPRAAVLIGGDSKTHKLSPDILRRHTEIVEDLIAKGFSLMISTSRRTPEFATRALSDIAARFDTIWLYEDDGSNPYLAFLGGAEIILVSEDSTNMLTEATRTGKPVFTLPMQGKPGKFSKLYDRLAEKCHVTSYDGQVSAPKYEPLDETTRIAKLLWERFDLFSGASD